MKLYVARHGQTYENVERIVQGQSIGTLNRTGHVQASRLADRLQDVSFSHIYCSDLARARHTAEHVLQHHADTAVAYTEKLREKSGGIYEGEPLQAIIDAEQASNQDFKEFAPPDGESFQDVADRVTAAYRAAQEKHDGPVLFITHGGPINMLLHHVHNEEPSPDSFKTFQPANTAVSVIDHTPAPEPVLVNCTAHLPNT